MEHYDPTYGGPGFNEYNDDGADLYALPAVEPAHVAAPLPPPYAHQSSSIVASPISPGVGSFGANYPSPIGSPGFLQMLGCRTPPEQPAASANFKATSHTGLTQNRGFIDQYIQYPSLNQAFTELSHAASKAEPPVSAPITTRPRRAQYQASFATSSARSDEGSWPAKRRKTGETPPLSDSPSTSPQKNKSPFTPDEDSLINDLYDSLGGAWEKIAETLQTDRDPEDVKDRLRKLREKARRKSRRASAPTVSVARIERGGGKLHRYPINKRFWTIEEDNLLRELVEQHGAHNWPEIASHLEGRSDNDCHSRWSRHLDPRLNKSAFTAYEDQQIVELQQVMGNKWKEIAVRIGTNRSGVQIHGRWLQLSKRSRPSPPAAAPKAKRGRKPASLSASAGTSQNRGRTADAAAAAGDASVAAQEMDPAMIGAIGASPMSISTRYNQIPPVQASPYVGQANASSSNASALIENGADNMSSYEEYDDISGDWPGNGPSFDESEAAALSDY